MGRDMPPIFTKQKEYMYCIIKKIHKIGECKCNGLSYSRNGIIGVVVAIVGVITVITVGTVYT